MSVQVILADSGYPTLRKMVPLWKREPGLDAAEREKRTRFNKLAAVTRVTVEQAIGSLKLRFPILSETMRCRPWNASEIFLCCCGLHNLLLNIGKGYFEDPEIDT